ncbi:hypothetical protein J3Q64DRAFT_1006148 [Phycomyces blakesleeanus]|uniref:Uncharacterized protein n=1 Tax=Phycomyces blakesleeanus TaxID=4837 RepID=A0ABR3BBZ0_PHYBL
MMMIIYCCSHLALLLFPSFSITQSLTRTYSLNHSLTYSLIPFTQTYTHTHIHKRFFFLKKKETVETRSSRKILPLPLRLTHLQFSNHITSITSTTFPPTSHHIKPRSLPLSFYLPLFFLLVLYFSLLFFFSFFLLLLLLLFPLILLFFYIFILLMCGF